MNWYYDREKLFKLWGSLSSCAPVDNRRSRRVTNPPQAASLPHMKRNISTRPGH